MGAVDTTYTFTATDTITSTKMNNIIDQTTMTTDAIIGNTLDVASGKLRVRAQGITSNEMGANSVVTAAITDSNITTAKIADANVTQAKLAPNVAGTGSVVISNRVGSAQFLNSAASGTTKVLFDNIINDTNGNFSNSRFTASVAGFYLLIGSVYVVNTAGLTSTILEFRTGAGSPPPRVIGGSYAAPQAGAFAISQATAIRYMAVGDWIETWVAWTSVSTASYVVADGGLTYFNASLIRSA